MSVGVDHAKVLRAGLTGLRNLTIKDEKGESIKIDNADKLLSTPGLWPLVEVISSRLVEMNAKDEGRLKNLP